MPRAGLATITQRVGKKHQEVLEREKQILSVARKLFDEVGYLGLTMDRIAEQVGWSKPTVYQHFSSKEEVMMGLALENIRERHRLNEQAASFNGRPRERMLAVGEAASRLYPGHIDLEWILYSTSIREKTSPEWQLLLSQEEARELGLLARIVEDAVAAGDLELPASMRVENVVYALWSLHFGGYGIYNTKFPFVQLETLRFTKLIGTVAWAGNAMMDGFGWRPLSSEWDYTKTLAKIRQELF